MGCGGQRLTPETLRRCHAPCSRTLIEGAADLLMEVRPGRHEITDGKDGKWKNHRVNGI